MVEFVTLLSVCVNPFGPLQLKLYGPFPPVALAVKEAKFPAQTVKDCGSTEQLGSVSGMVCGPRDYLPALGGGLTTRAHFDLKRVRQSA